MKLFIYIKIVIIFCLFSSSGVSNEISERKAANIYADFLKIINKNSYNNISNEAVVKDSIRNVLKEFNDGSYFMDEYSSQELAKIGKGYYYGIGVNLVNNKGIYNISNIIEGSPAFEYGLSKGDTVLEISGEKLTEKNINNLLSGKLTQKTIGLVVKKITTNEVLRYNIPKKEIKIQNIESRNIDNVLYIKIKAFNNEVVNDIKKLLAKVNNNEISSYIIDLRDNVGGLLYQAVGFVDLILDEGVVVEIERKNLKPREVFYAHKGNIFGQKKIVVLVNKRSASASEIVASALQDHKRAVVMGSNTFGKTTVQQLYKLDKIGTVAITIAKYYRPNGSSLTKGVTPDIILNNKSKASNAQIKEDQLLKLALEKIKIR